MGSTGTEGVLQRIAINAAATGHLVISTLHASTASEVVNRIVSFFDPVDRDLVLHLIASHHGRCRPFAPVVVDSRPETVSAIALGLPVQASSDTQLHRLESGVAEIATVVSATEEHSQANANRSRESAIANVKRMVELRNAGAHQLLVIYQQHRCRIRRCAHQPGIVAVCRALDQPMLGELLAGQCPGPDGLDRRLLFRLIRQQLQHAVG